MQGILNVPQLLHIIYTVYSRLLHASAELVEWSRMECCRLIGGEWCGAKCTGLCDRIDFAIFRLAKWGKLGKKCGQSNFHYGNTMSNKGFGQEQMIQVCLILVWQIDMSLMRFCKYSFVFLNNDQDNEKLWESLKYIPRAFVFIMELFTHTRNFQ